MDLGRIRIGTRNVQTLRSEAKQQQLLDDISNKRITITAIQETHLQGTGTEQLKTRTGEKYNLYYTGDGKSSGGVGFIVRDNIKVEFHPLTSRTCRLDALLKDGRKLTVISTYAPTNPKCLKDPSLREKS